MPYGYDENDPGYDVRDADAADEERAFFDALVEWVDTLRIDDTYIELWADRPDILDVIGGA